jgi:hypothetical protein
MVDWLVLVLVAAAVYFTAKGRSIRLKEERLRRHPGGFDAADQLRHVMAARFTKKTLMSRAEFRVFRITEEASKAAQKGLRVFAQTSLGEVIGSDDRQAFDAVNSKRVDVLVVDYSGHPVAAVEYQGGGHYQGNAAARDAVKKEALRRAGVAYVEILDHDDDEMIRRKLDAVLLSRESIAAAG